MFHVCTIGQLDEPMDIKFLCLNGTVFDQETRVCERVDEVDCTRSERFYYLNLELYGNTMVPIPEGECEQNNFRRIESKLTTSPLDNDDDADGDDDDNDSHSEASSTTPIPSTKTPSTTPTTTSTTTTRRPSTSASTARPATTTYRSAPRTQAPKKIASSGSQTSTLKPKASHYLTTAKPYNNEDDEDNHQSPPSAGDDNDYTYDDTDYAVTDGKDLNNYQDPGNSSWSDKLVAIIVNMLNSLNSLDNFGHENHEDGIAEHVFSPQQFIFNQNSNNNKGSLGSSQAKPAISFQQQQFQNGGSLTVTNSHVTVTTHTAADDNNNTKQKVNKQFSSRPNKDAVVTAGPSTAEEDEQHISAGSSTRKPQFSYGPPPATPKRPALVPSIGAAQQSPPSGHPGLPNIPNFQITAHGFRLPNAAQLDLLQAAQDKHAQELKTHQQQILDQLKQQHDLSPQEKHLRELEKHQHRLEQLQQQEISKQLREQEAIRQEQEQRRQEQERKNQEHEQQQQQEQAHQLHLQQEFQSSPSNHFEGYRRHTPQVD